METARTEVMNIPPTAMPPSKAIRFIGAIMYNWRFPISFSQYSWLAIDHSTFNQNATIAPPSTTLATSAFMLARMRGASTGFAAT